MGGRVVVEIGKEGNERENESDDEDGDGWSWWCCNLGWEREDGEDDGGAQLTQLVIISLAASSPGTNYSIFLLSFCFWW